MTRKSATGASSKKPTPANPYQPTPVEIAAVTAHNERSKARVKAPRIKLHKIESHKTQLAPDHTDPVVWHAALEEAFGTCSSDAAALLTDAAFGVVHPNPEKIDETAFNGVLGILHGINPADEIEAMLASQMAGLHLTSMQCMRRAQLSEQTFEARDMNLKHASKLSRAFAGQVEALKRYRTGGQQKVTVEHVTVNQGGQAIVGSVTAGGGAAAKSED
jgi:hypothetical protein